MYFSGLFGLEVIESVEAVRKVETSVARSWRERLTGWPWRPWAKTKIVVTYEPCFYQMNLTQPGGYRRDVIVAHPEVARQLRMMNK